jgi:hypothetical protein
MTDVKLETLYPEIIKQYWINNNCKLYNFIIIIKYKYYNIIVYKIIAYNITI